MSSRRSRSASASRGGQQPPKLGAALRLAFHSVTQQFAVWLAKSRYRELQPAHSAVIQPLFGEREGMRLTTIAARGRVTKQTIGPLVDQLERHGYVERLVDPADRRASLIRLTGKGQTYALEARAFMAGIEARLAARIGARRIGELLETLQLVYQLTGDPKDG